jgi:hypothetical protein
MGVPGIGLDGAKGMTCATGAIGKSGAARAMGVPGEGLAGAMRMTGATGAIGKSGAAGAMGVLGVHNIDTVPGESPHIETVNIVVGWDRIRVHHIDQPCVLVGFVGHLCRASYHLLIYSLSIQRFF